MEVHPTNIAVICGACRHGACRHRHHAANVQGVVLPTEAAAPFISYLYRASCCCVYSPERQLCRCVNLLETSVACHQQSHTGMASLLEHHPHHLLLPCSRTTAHDLHQCAAAAAAKMLLAEADMHRQP
jgi:hypothetical protein